MGEMRVAELDPVDGYSSCEAAVYNVVPRTPFPKFPDSCRERTHRLIARLKDWCHMEDTRPHFKKSTGGINFTAIMWVTTYKSILIACQIPLLIG